VEQVKRLTRHFLQRWRDRIGTDPSLEEVNRILRRSCRVKRQQHLWVNCNGRLEPYKTLSLWWSHPDGLILWVDDERGAAVTVIAHMEDEHGN